MASGAASRAAWISRTCATALTAMSASGSACPPMWLVCAARLKMTAASSHRGRRSMSRMSPRTNSTSAPSRLRGLAPPPNRKPSSATTRAPRRASAWHRLEPRKPAPPVTKTLRSAQSMRWILQEQPGPEQLGREQLGREQPGQEEPGLYRHIVAICCHIVATLGLRYGLVPQARMPTGEQAEDPEAAGCQDDRRAGRDVQVE